MSPEIRRRYGRLVRARWSAAPTSAGAGRFAEVAVPLEQEGVLILLSDSLADPISSLKLIQRRAPLRRLDRASSPSWPAISRHRCMQRIDSSGAADRPRADADEPVTDTGNDELGDLANAFERMGGRLGQLDRARSEFIANASHERERRSSLWAASSN